MSKDIPEELVTTEILHRLPAKAVGRFRCVSKKWRSFLSSRQFVKAHLNFNLRRHPRHLLVMRSDDSCYDLTLDSISSSANLSEEDGNFRKVRCPLENEKFFWLRRFGSSCHGLVVFSVGDGHIRFLMNPVTGEALRVRKWPPGGVYGMVHGLGYDASSDDYKIVNISWCLGGGQSVDVYSVGLNCWRNCPISQGGFEPSVPFNGVNGVFVNGSIHWLGQVDDASNSKGYRSVICAFNLTREEFEEVQPPSSSVVELAYQDQSEIKLLGGCLALVVAPFSDQKKCFSIDVWLMKEYGVRDSWTKLTINGPEDRSINVRECEVISLSNEDEVVLMNMVKLVAYNCRSGIWRDLVAIGFSNSKAIGDSLVSPNYS